MDEREWLAQRFEPSRCHLRAVAYRMLGSLSGRTMPSRKPGFGSAALTPAASRISAGWLTTVVAHVCLDILRSRASRREESLASHVPEPMANNAGGVDPEGEAVLADSVGLALLVVLDRLTPAARLAFVLHDSSPCPSTKSLPSSGAPRARQGSSPAARAAGCRDWRWFPTPISPNNEGLSTLSLLLCAVVTLRASLPCLIPTSWFESMRPRRAQVRRERSAVRGTGPRGRWPSHRLPFLRNRHLSMDEWDSSWLRADGCSGCSGSRSLAERLHKSMWLATEPASASST